MAKLKNVKNQTARCPAHDDRNNSLGVREEGGRILIHCYAGCKPEAVVAALGCTMADLFTGPPPTRSLKKKPEILATYDYRDEEGALLYQVMRHFPKDFRQRRPDPERPGKWMYNLDGVRRVIYRLPEVRAAIAKGDTIFVVEGEKDVAVLEAWGLVGTTNSGGAGKWRPEHSAALEQASRIVILPDNDAPGRDHAWSIARQLPQAVVVELPGLSAKGDLTDWVRQGGTCEDLLKLVEAVAANPPAPPGCAGATPADAFQSAECQEPFEWEAPLPFKEGRPAVPAFDFLLLPELLRDWAADVTERLQCPPEYVAVALMTAIASVVGRRLGVRPKEADEWCVVPNLWAAIVGPPGVMKSPALREGMAALYQLEDGAREEHARAMRMFEAEQLVNEAAEKEAKAAIKKNIKNRDRAFEYALSIVDGGNGAPRRRRFIVNDVTVEKLGEILMGNENGVMLFRDELVGFLRSLDKSGREVDRAFYLECWNGDGRFTYDRIQRGTVEIEAACVSILGGIQPGPLAEYMRETVRQGAGQDGLIQRFQLLVWPDIAPEWKNVDRMPDALSRDRALGIFFDIAQSSGLELGGEDAGRGIPFVRFAPEAQHTFNEWRTALELRLRSDQEHPTFVAHLAKYRSLVPSLALLVHLADGGRGSIGTRPLLTACAWGEFLEAHARRVYSLSLEPVKGAASLLLDRILNGEVPEIFTARDVYRNGWRGLSEPDEVKKALEVLEAHHYLRSCELSTGGRSSLEYHLNPRAKEAA